MGKDLRIFLLAVGIPALAIAGAGICLISNEIKRERARQEERAKEHAKEHEERRRERQEAMRRNGVRPRPGDGSGPRGERRRAAHQRPFIPRLFSPEESLATQRILWIGGCMLGLLFLSFGTGGLILVRSARKAREEALMKTDFLSNVSHEFKTPLTTICLCAELAQDGGLGEERRNKALSAILAEANRLKGLVLNALDFSRLEKNRRVFTMRECDICGLTREAAEPMRERFFAGLTLPEGTLTATADADAFRQIVVILLDNAAKYAAAGGPVEVAISATPAGAALTVSDRGPGLGREGMKRAFERFWRGDSAVTAETGGSGLGLSIARSLARGMGGDLTVAARGGGGLVFTLTLK